MSRESYIAEANRQLNNTNHYRKLDQDPTSQHAEQVKSLIHTMVGNRDISKETGKYPTLPTPGRPGCTTSQKSTNLVTLEDQLFPHAELPPSASLSLQITIYNPRHAITIVLERHQGLPA